MKFVAKRVLLTLTHSNYGCVRNFSRIETHTIYIYIHVFMTINSYLLLKYMEINIYIDKASLMLFPCVQK